jgi:choline monooxygenase|tara:strand:+ start:35553 stop:36641 length:1089 start_codon:yes stop_codon:yes gene_type:complete
VSTVNLNINKSKTIPSEYYYSKKKFEIIKNRIFNTHWQLICDEKQLQNHGDVFPYIFMDNFIEEPLLLINNNNKIYSLTNVCTHRGNILVENKCNVKNGIRCRYHGRKFKLCGQFQFMPKCEDIENFPSESDNLKSISCEKWKQFYFTSLNPKFNFRQLTQDMDNRIGWMPIEKFRFSKKHSKEYTVNANWALYCDNYLEGFHIPFVHEGLSENLNYAEYNTELFKYSNLQIGIGKKDDICFEIPKNSIDYGKKIAAYYFWLFPNMMFNFYPWGLSINIVIPINPEKTKVKFLSYIWDESKLNTGAGAEIDKVEQEDEEIVEQVQRGVKSRFYDRGHFSPSMEKGVHHFHLLLSKFIDANSE